MILTADLHITDKLTQGRPRLSVGLGVLQQIYVYAKNNDSVVFILGDLFDSKNRITFRTLLAIYEFFEKHQDVKWYLLRGNHCSPDRANPEESVLSLFRHVCTVIAQPTYANGIVWMPWYPAKMYMEKLKAIQLQGKTNYLFSHIGLKGGAVSQSNYHPPSDISADELFEIHPWQMVLLGDYHLAQQIGNKPCYYLGAPMAHEFGEIGCGVWKLTETGLLGNLPIRAPAFKSWKIVKGARGLDLLDYDKADYNRITAPVEVHERFKEQYPDAELLSEPGAREVETSPVLLDDQDSLPVLMEEYLRIRGLVAEKDWLMPLGLSIVSKLKKEAVEA